MPPSPPVRYVENGDNRLLRLALLEAWNHTCYWHKAPLAFDEATIDHILPRSAEPVSYTHLTLPTILLV